MKKMKDRTKDEKAYALLEPRSFGLLLTRHLLPNRSSSTFFFFSAFSREFESF